MTTPDAPKGSAVRTFIDTLAALGIEYAGAISGGNGGKWACPIHDDEHPSLDVTVGRNGKPIFTCTPCQQAMGQDEFVVALRSAGVSWSGAPCKPEDVDWGPAAVVVNPTTKGGKGEVKLTAVYTYKHADGSDNFKVKRYDPTEGSEARKHFRPARYERGKGYVSGLDGVERTPYYLDRFEEWAGQPIYLVEGEKAADALVEAGKAATTFHGGTAGKVEPDWPTKYGFDRFEEVRLWPDADEAGVDRMVALAADLNEKCSYMFWGVPAGHVEAKDDAFDVLARGQTPIGLTGKHLDALRALHPKPVHRVKDRSPAERPPEALAPNGKPIGSVSSSSSPEAPTEPDDEPYPVSLSQAPYEFTAEMVEREFMTDGTLTLRFRVDDRTFWHWGDTRYVRMTDDEVRATVKQRLAGQREVFQPAPKDGVFPAAESRPIKVTEAKTSEVINHLRSLTLTSAYGAGALIANEGGVPFLNGWLDVETGELKPLTPNRDVRWNVPAEYDAKAKCPEWIAFLKSIGWGPGTEEYVLCRQWFGNLISGSTAFHKGMLLIGPKRAGKGTVLGVAEGLMGEGAVGIQLDAFSNNFGMQNLIGKGLATIGDARFGFKTDKSIIERLLSLTSFDLMQIDAKWEKPYSIRLGSRLMIATNEVPAFIEASDALSTRFLVLEFTESFYGREDLTLKRRILKELPGIARWALGGYEELIGLGSFTETSKGLAVQQAMIRDAAPIRVFVEEECVIEPGRSVENQKLFDRYLIWCDRNNTFKMSHNKFSRDLNTAFPGKFTDYYKRTTNGQVRSKKGIGLK
jgi:P4 family phage/plasmid primase-like protien